VNKKQKKVVVPLSEARTSLEKTGSDKVRKELVRQLAQKDFSNTAITVMLLEIDDFQGFMKVFGPKRVGRLLEEVESILSQTLRTGDRIVFHGGNKFGLLLVGTSSKAAPEVGYRIRAAIKESAFAPEHGHVLKVTVSGGYATHMGLAPQDTAQELVELAEDCLRQAREGGQDRIIGQSSPASTLDFPEAETQD
jgi:diguanylate cyclase (GGDEF)-like protein